MSYNIMRGPLFGSPRRSELTPAEERIVIQFCRGCGNYNPDAGEITSLCRKHIGPAHQLSRVQGRSCVDRYDINI